MKKLSKLKLNDSHEMSDGEMKNVVGGVARKEYCDSLQHITNGSGWSDQEWDNWSYAYDTH